jgi:hypothetical protein
MRGIIPLCSELTQLFYVTQQIDRIASQFSIPIAGQNGIESEAKQHIACLLILPNRDASQDH